VKVWTTEFCVVSLCQTDSFAEIIMVQTHPISAPRLTCPSPADRGGGLTGATACLREKQASVACMSSSMAAGSDGAAALVPIRRAGREGEGEEERRRCVCLSPCIIFFSRCGGSSTLLGEISAKPCAAHDF
jgi:hypothetical protein